MADKKKQRKRFVQPSPEPLGIRAEIVERLRSEIRITEPEAQQVADLFLLPSLLPSRTAVPQTLHGSGLTFHLQQFCNFCKRTEGRLDISLLLFLESLSRSALYPSEGDEGPEWKLESSHITAFAEIAKGSGSNLNVPIRDFMCMSGPEFNRNGLKWGQWDPKFLRGVITLGLINPSDLIDLQSLCEDGVSPDILGDFTSSSEYESRQSTQPQAFYMWLQQTGALAIESVARAVSGMNDSDAAFAVRGLLRACILHTARDLSSDEREFWPGIQRTFRAALVPVFEALLTRIQNASKDHSEVLKEAVVWLGSTIYADSPDVMPDAIRTALISESVSILGSARSIVKLANTSMTRERWLATGYLREAAIRLLLKQAPLWKTLKPFLLMLRSCPVPTVSSDLRYWTEEKRTPLPEWSDISASFANLLNNCAYREQKSDPTLQELRSSFAEFCLERLRTRRGVPKASGLADEAALVESNPMWREACIHAARELRINPGGKGHHTLFWSMKHDPDQQVRSAAETAYNELRHDPELTDAMPPRRAILAAFWWIRQAHFNATSDEPIDERGAQRTRDKEGRRAKEIEDQFREDAARMKK